MSQDENIYLSSSFCPALTKQIIMVRLVAAALLLLTAQVARGDERRCHLDQVQLQLLFSPLLENADWNNVTLPEQKKIRPECEARVRPMMADLVNLAKARRIVHPDERADEIILQSRADAFLQTFAALKSHTDDATVKILEGFEPRLKEVKRQFAEFKQTPEMKTLRSVFSDETNKAANQTEQLATPEEYLRKVLSLGFDASNTTFLKYLLEYTNDLSNFSLSFVGYNVLYDRMKEHDLEASPDALLLTRFVGQDVENSEFQTNEQDLQDGYKALLVELYTQREFILRDLVKDLNAKKYESLKMLTDALDYQTVNEFVPDLIDKLYTPGDLWKVSGILDIISKFPTFDNDCVAYEALYLLMSRLNQHETFEAHNLWLSTSTLIHQQPDYEKVVEDTKAKCARVEKALAKYSEKHVLRYVELLDRKEWTTLKWWHKTYTNSIRWILPKVVQRQKDIYLLLEMVDIVPYLEEDCLIFDALMTMYEQKPDLWNSVQVRAFAALRASLQAALESELTESYLKKCQKAKSKAPEWIERLLWQDTSRCRLVNRKVQEELLATNETINSPEKAGQDAVFTAKARQGTQWNVTVDQNGGVTFENALHPESYLSHAKNLDTPLGLTDLSSVSESSNKWNLAKVKNEDFYVIFTHSDDADDPENRARRHLSVKTDDTSSLRRVVLVHDHNDPETHWSPICAA